MKKRLSSVGFSFDQIAAQLNEMGGHHRSEYALCVERAKATLKEQRRIAGLSYVFDAMVLDQTLWILMNTPDDAPAVMLAVASDGKIMRRVLFSNVLGARSFAFDRVGGRIYFSIPSTASIVASSVPDTILQY